MPWSSLLFDDIDTWHILLGKSSQNFILTSVANLGHLGEGLFLSGGVPLRFLLLLIIPTSYTHQHCLLIVRIRIKTSLPSNPWSIDRLCSASQPPSPLLTYLKWLLTRLHVKTWLFFNVVSSLSLIIVFARTVYFTILLIGGFKTSERTGATMLVTDKVFYFIVGPW